MASSAEVAAWRLVRPEYAPGLDGEGARLAGGRWNSPGLPMVYAASSLSLAVLEVFVHLPPEMRTRDGLPELTAVRLAVPEALIEEAPGDIAGESTGDARAFGDRWLQEVRSTALRVPSAVVPPETNILLNPRHGDFGRIGVSAQIPFRFDPRIGL